MYGKKGVLKEEEHRHYITSMCQVITEAQSRRELVKKLEVRLSEMISDAEKSGIQIAKEDYPLDLGAMLDGYRTKEAHS